MSEKLQNKISLILDRVRSGYGFSHVSDFPGFSYNDALKNFVNIGKIDQEDAHLAIIKGKENRAERLLYLFCNVKDIPYEDYKDLEAELRCLAGKGYVDQEEVHLAIIRKKREYN